MSKTQLIMMISTSMALMGLVSCQAERKWTEKKVDNFMAVSQEDSFIHSAMFLSQVSSY